MTHDELLAKIDQWAKNSLGVGDLTHQQMCYGDNCKCYEHDEQGESLVKALRKVVIETDRPSISDNVMWTDGWKCAMLTIFLAIERELNDTR